MTIFNTLCERGKNTLKFQLLWSVILPNLSENGLMITSYLWNTINPEKFSEFNLSKMKNRFFGKFDPDVQTLKRKERDVENEFIRNLDTYCQVGITGTGKICKEEFDGFMKCLSFTSKNERQFLMRIVECFRLNEFSAEFGIKGTAGNEINQGWRKEWGDRQEKQTSNAFQKRQESNVESNWGHFTQGKEEIKRSRRGRSAINYNEKKRNTPWADETSLYRNNERESNKSKYSRRFQAEEKSSGIFHQRNNSGRTKSQMRKQYSNNKKNNDIFNTGHDLESNEGVRLLVLRLRGVLKACKLRAYDLIYIANAIIKSFLVNQSVSGNEFEKILEAVTVRWNSEGCDSISKRFLNSKRGIVELLDMLKGRMSTRKQTMEMKLWNVLDYNKIGSTKYGNLMNIFKGDFHPLVINRKLRVIEINKEFEEGIKLFDQMKKFISETKISENYGANEDAYRKSMVYYTTDQLENKTLKIRDFNEWFSYYSFEEDDDNKFQRMYKDVFKIY